MGERVWGCTGKRTRVVEPDGGFGVGGEAGMSADGSQPPCWCTSAVLALLLTVWDPHGLVRVSFPSSGRMLCVPALLGHSQCSSTTVFFL